MPAAFKAMIWAILLASAIVLSACNEHHSLRYRITLTVDDNGKSISGTEVREQEFIQQQFNIDGDKSYSQTSGDAIVLPINGRFLAVTLNGWRPSSTDGFVCTGAKYSPDSFRADHLAWTLKYHPDGVPCFLTDDWSPVPILWANSGLRRPSDTFGALALLKKIDPQPDVAIPDDQLPALVTFDGPPSLASVQPLDVRHLDQVFGPSVKFQSASVQITNDPVTRDVGNVLPFAMNRPGKFVCVFAGDGSNRGSTTIQLGSGTETEHVNQALGTCPTEDMFHR